MSPLVHSSHVLDSHLQNWSQSSPGIGEVGYRGSAALLYNLCYSDATPGPVPTRLASGFCSFYGPLRLVEQWPDKIFCILEKIEDKGQYHFYSNLLSDLPLWKFGKFMHPANHTLAQCTSWARSKQQRLPSSSSSKPHEFNFVVVLVVSWVHIQPSQPRPDLNNKHAYQMFYSIKKLQ